jgi:predicted Fe-Mo cluster-binding NifX family protein
MRLALTTWNGRISPVFDVARQVLVADIEDGRVVSRREEGLPGTEPPAQAARLAALGPQVLICGAISQPMSAMLAGTGIRVIPFTAGEAEDVLAAWLAGRLPDPAWRMPGCGGRGGCGGGPGRGMGRRGCGGGGRRQRNGGNRGVDR